MLYYILCRSMMMFAQATTGTPAAPIAPQGAPVQVSPVSGGGGFRHTIWHTILLIVFFIISLALIIAILLQTTKSEGLSGIIGGSTQSVFHGKKGFEERLQEVTNYLAVAFVVMALLVTIFAFKPQ